MEINLLTLSIAIGLGIAIGMFASLSGTGGGVLNVPIFETALLLDITVAQGTSSFVIFFNSLSTNFAYGRQKRIDYKTGLLLVVFSAPMAMVGVLVSDAIATGFDLGKLWLIIIFYVFLLFIAIRMLLKKPRNPGGDNTVGNENPLSKGRFIMHRRIIDRDGECFEHSFHVAKVIPLAMLGGFVGGFFGLGGGVIQVPMLNGACGMGIHLSVATSGFMIIFNSIISTLTRVQAGQVDFVIGVIYAIGSLFGAQIGAKIAKKASRPRLKKIISIFLMSIAIYKIINIIVSF